MKEKLIRFHFTLEEAVEAHTKQFVAERLGLTPTAVGLMLEKGREIYIKKKTESRWIWLEVKDWKLALDFLKPPKPLMNSPRRGKSRPRTSRR